MRAYCCHTYRMIRRLSILVLAGAALVAGCGQDMGNGTAGVGTGGTGGGTGITLYLLAAGARDVNPVGVNITGHVLADTAADGYLVNATVFLDRNSNYQLDTGEPSTTTDTAGAYRLALDPADVGAYPLVALAVKGQTIDQNTGQPVGSSYVLSLSKENVSGRGGNFIRSIPEAFAEPGSR